MIATASIFDGEYKLPCRFAVNLSNTARLVVSKLNDPSIVFNTKSLVNSVTIHVICEIIDKLRRILHLIMNYALGRLLLPRLVLATRKVLDHQEREFYEARLNTDAEFPLDDKFNHLRVSANTKDKIVREGIKDLKQLRERCQCQLWLRNSSRGFSSSRQSSNLSTHT
jgi:hypothetical protein